MTSTESLREAAQTLLSPDAYAMISVTTLASLLTSIADWQEARGGIEQKSTGQDVVIDANILAAEIIEARLMAEVLS